MWSKYFNNYVTNMGGYSDINGNKMSTFQPVKMMAQFVKSYIHTK